MTCFRCVAETRANLDCDLLHTWFPTLASASCLRMDPLYYQVPSSLAQKHAHSTYLVLAASST